MMPVPKICSDVPGVNKNEVCRFYCNSLRPGFCFLVLKRTIMLSITFHVNNLDFTHNIFRALAQ